MTISQADRKTVTDHLSKAFRELDRISFQHEPAYVIALLARLLGKIELEDGRYINFKTSSTNDRGTGSAEKEFGADFGLVLTWSETNEKKAILGQAKNGYIEKLGGNDLLSLNQQCKKMAAITSQFVVLQCPQTDGAEPHIFLGENNEWVPPPILFTEFILDQVMGCCYGDTEQTTAERIERSDLKNLLEISTNLPKPRPRAKIKPTRRRT